jgi:hypothetical protein
MVMSLYFDPILAGISFKICKAASQYLQLHIWIHVSRREQQI